MCKFKKGDQFVVVSENSQHNFKKGEVVTLVSCEKSFMMCFKSKNGESQLLLKSEVKLLGYEISNRHKLHQEIKATGLRADDLSVISGFSKGYFSDYASKSRFNKRGDISESRLSELLTSLAFAERELLGVGAKTVDDESIDVKVQQAKDALDTFSIGNSDQEDFDYYKSHQKPESKIVKYGLPIIAILLLVLLFINLGK